MLMEMTVTCPKSNRLLIKEVGPSANVWELFDTYLSVKSFGLPRGAREKLFRLYRLGKRHGHCTFSLAGRLVSIKPA